MRHLPCALVHHKTVLGVAAVVVSITAFVPGAAVAAPPPLFHITNLGTFGGPSSGAWAINASGQVVGQADTSFPYLHGFRTSANQPINPATDELGLPGRYAAAFGINNSGQVVGEFIGDFGPGTTHAFRTNAGQAFNGTTDDLGALIPGLGTSAYGINAGGQVVGISDTVGGNGRRSFRTAPNKPINPATDDLGTLGATFTIARGINDIGQVVGYSNTVNGQTHVFRTAPNQKINPATDDLGTLEFAGYGIAINASGQVAGAGDTHNGYRAFRTAPNKPINPATDNLGTLPNSKDSYGWGMNNAGDVVGFTYDAQGASYHAFLVQGSTMFDLNNLLDASGAGWTIVQANSINDSGQIVGFGRLNGQQRAYLLTPVPEPSTLSLICIGLIGAAMFRALMRRSFRK